MSAIKVFDSELPKELSKDELKKLFIEYKNGSIKAKEKIIKHNLRLVLLVLNRMSDIVSEYDDLFQAGCIGLTKAVETYDVDKNIAFSTYAYRVIRNKILHYLKMNKRHLNKVSLNQLIETEDSLVEFENLISDNYDFTIIFENKELTSIAVSFLEELSDRDKEILKLYYGFYDRQYSAVEIAKMLGYTRFGVAKIIQRNLGVLKSKFKNVGVDGMDFTEGKVITKF